MIQRAKTSKKKKKMISLASLEVTMTNYQYYPAIRYETEVFCNPKKKNDRCEVFNCVLDDIKEVICNFFFILPSHTHPLSINKKKKHKKQSAEKTKTNEH